MGIYISAGHSNSDPGAVANGRKEADIAVEFRNIVSFYLHKMKVIHGTDGQGTENLPLKIAAANAKRATLAVEFHCNAGPTTATGVEVLAGPNRKNMASALCALIAETIDIRNRGFKPENSGQHKRLAFVQAGGMIVELLFITNPRDLAKYDARKWVLGKAVAEFLAAAV